MEKSIKEPSIVQLQNRNYYSLIFALAFFHPDWILLLVLNGSTHPHTILGGKSLAVLSHLQLGLSVFTNARQTQACVLI